MYEIRKFDSSRFGTYYSVFFLDNTFRFALIVILLAAAYSASAFSLKSELFLNESSEKRGYLEKPRAFNNSKKQNFEFCLSFKAAPTLS